MQQVPVASLIMDQIGHLTLRAGNQSTIALSRYGLEVWQVTTEQQVGKERNAGVWRPLSSSVFIGISYSNQGCGQRGRDGIESSILPDAPLRKGRSGEGGTCQNGKGFVLILEVFVIAM